MSKPFYTDEHGPLYRYMNQCPYCVHGCERCNWTSALVTTTRTPRPENTCATCKHWARHDPEDWEVWGEDDSPEPAYPLSMSKAFGTCALGATHSGRQDHPQALMAACDTEQYAARLVTHQTFGCVMYERRD
jgi:hypothetical protein